MRQPYRLECEQVGNRSSTIERPTAYHQTARGRPASRRIPSPPECLPRGTSGRSAVSRMSGFESESAARLKWSDDMYDLSKPLEIDAVILNRVNARGRGIRLDASWACLPPTAALALGRRALDVGYHAHLGPHDERQSAEWASVWREGAEAASSAKAALRRLLLFLSPTDVALTSIPSLAKPLRQQIARFQPDLDLQAQQDEAERQAAALLEAWKVIEAIPDYMTRNHQSVSKGRKNPGAPEKRAFVFQLGVAWSLLTGRKPGKSPDPDKNPFYVLVLAAWQDLGGPEEAFEGAIRSLDADAALAHAKHIGLEGFG